MTEASTVQPVQMLTSQKMYFRLRETFNLHLNDTNAGCRLHDL